MVKKASLLSLSLLCACGIVVAQSRRWQVPTYRGFKLGKSTKADVERAFGKPVWSGHPIYEEPEGEVKDELLYEYENVGGFDGRTSVYLDARRGVVKAISLYPNYQKPLSFNDAIAQYGNEYTERGSKLGPCPTAKELRGYKPQHGREYPIFLVYPQRGMYVSIDRDNKVQEIGYLLRCPPR
jgi:hypothetical protein